MTSQLNVALIHKLLGSVICLAYFLNMLFMGAFATRHCQTFGRLVQELCVCTVPKNRSHEKDVILCKLLIRYMYES